MKRPEVALAEWAGDCITFVGYRTGREPWTLEQFEKVCSIMRCSPEEIPLLHNVIRALTQEMQLAGWPPDRRSAWYDSFFSPANMVRFRSVYEVKYALQREAEKLRAKRSLVV